MRGTLPLICITQRAKHKHLTKWPGCKTLSKISKTAFINYIVKGRTPEISSSWTVVIPEFLLSFIHVFQEIKITSFLFCLFSSPTLRIVLSHPAVTINFCVLLGLWSFLLFAKNRFRTSFSLKNSSARQALPFHLKQLLTSSSDSLQKSTVHISLWKCTA